MAEVLMISAQTIKDRSALASALDVERIRPTIRKAQRRHLLKALGSGLYDKIISDIDGDSLAGVYETLVNTYISEALIQWTIMEGYDDWHYSVEGGSVQVRNSDNARAVGEEEINRLKGHARSDAIQETVRLIEYICKNASSFSEYGAEGAVTGNICPASVSDYQGGQIEYAHRTSRSRLKRWQYDRRR